MRSEGAFAHLAEVAPIPAFSGRTHHQRPVLDRDAWPVTFVGLLSCTRSSASATALRAAGVLRRFRFVRLEDLRQERMELAALVRFQT
ncbi:hypothetical protein GCM10009680_84790 [Streptomyces yatensis]|uniref:Uncharacterized protein n=1 Tax=Streptomyces yatensis TaxID=155177 RepID=A0ABN2JL22_9ACTN